jgi:hypothetical protein
VEPSCSGGSSIREARRAGKGEVERRGTRRPKVDELMWSPAAIAAVSPIGLTAERDGSPALSHGAEVMHGLESNPAGRDVPWGADRDTGLEPAF